MLHDVGVLSQFMYVPRKPNLDATHKVLHYTNITLNYGLFFVHRVDIEVLGYTNADWAGCTYDRRSPSGYVFNLVVAP